MSFDGIIQQLRDESNRLHDEAAIVRLRRLGIARLLSDAADVIERLGDWRLEATEVLAEWVGVWMIAGQPGPLGSSKAQNVGEYIQRLRSECDAWMNGVADVVEPLGYDRGAASGPSDLLPGLTDLRNHDMESTRRLSECVEARSYLYQQVVALSAQLDAARLNEIKPIAGPPDATDVELDSVGSSCDWGGCNAESVGLRWSPKFAGYLPVCERHQGTLDNEGVCVRCGAPGMHCQCEDVADDGHWWVAPSVGANATEWTVCQRCGNVKRQDGKPSSECRGPVRVGLRRANPFDEHTRMWEDEIRGMGINPDHVKKIVAKSKPYIDYGADPPAPRGLPPFDPETLAEVARWYESNGREMQ